MRFLLDNDVDHAVASLLRSLGHDVVAASEVGLGGAVTVSDSGAEDASLTLAAEGVQAGMTGVAGLAGSRMLLRGLARRQFGLDTDAVVVVLCTEGMTDPAEPA